MKLHIHTFEISLSTVFIFYLTDKTKRSRFRFGNRI